jgi:hypothetical protein
MRNIKIFFVVAFIFSMVYAEVGPTEDKGIVYVIRKKSLKGAAVEVGINEGEDELGRIANGRVKYVMLEPGEYSIGGRKEKKQVSVKVEANKSYYLSCKPKMSMFNGLGDWGAPGAFELISEKEAKKLMKKTKGRARELDY